MPPIHRIPRTGSAASLATRAVVTRLETMAPGDTVSYSELSTVAGVNVQERRDLLETARRIVRRLHGKEFDVEINQGLVCLSEPGKVGLGARRRQFAHRQARKTADILQTVVVDQLTPLEQHCWLAELSIAAAVSLATHDKTVRQIEAQGTPQPLLIDPRAYKDLMKGL